MASRSSLYKWKKQEPASAFASRGNVQEWVKQVQKASDDAARDIFGDQSSTLFSKKNVFVDDAAISEAQDLLDSWIQKKKVDDLMAECDLGEEKWSQIAPKNSQHKIANDVGAFRLGSDGTIVCDPLDLSCQEDSIEEIKPAFDLNDEFDEEYAVQEVVHNMLGKDLVNVGSLDTDILRSKGKKFKDPTPKMELRHKEVKEKAKGRKMARTNAHQRKMTQKLVEQEARKQLDREEKQKIHKAKQEDEEIRREMVKIRKAMQDENRMRTKQELREKEENESASKLAKEEVIKHQKEKESEIKRGNAAKAAMKMLLLKQVEEDKSRQKQRDLKLLHQCFSSWYTIVVNKRIKIGKARALFDWRHKLRTWNAWRTYVRRLKSDRETRALTQEIRERHRKEALADRFYHQVICQRCLTGWLSYVWKEKQERNLKDQHDERASKMASLLKAAASGQFWQKPEENANNQGSGRAPDSNCDEEVEEIFLQPLKREPACVFVNKEVKARGRNGMKKPAGKQAWPHEILRDMKKQKTRHGVSNEVASCDEKQQGSSHSSVRNKHTSNVNNISNGNDTNINEIKRLETRPSFAESQSRVAVVSGNTSKVELDDRTVPTNITAVTPRDVKVGDQAPSTSRSSASVTSKQSKVTTRRPPTKPLHLAMEERAKVRAERKSLLEARKREAEEQQLIKLKKEQELKEKEIEAEKQAMFEKRREEKRIAKQREFEKQQRFEEIKTLNQRADNHYRMFLVRNFGLRPWKRLVKDTGDITCSAIKYSDNRLQRICFREWSGYTRQQCELRDELTKNFYKRMLLRHAMLSWKKHRHHLIEMHHIAVDFSKRYLARKYIRIWQDYVIEERMMYWDKENRADEHNERRLKQIALTYWKKYIPLLKQEEKREKRREDLRKHVQSLLPDFQGMKLSH